MRFVFLLVLFLTGCDCDFDNDTFDRPTSPCSGNDCNDFDASVYPGAPEVCNGVDDNCDGLEDEGLLLTYWWPDADGDGFGADSPTQQGCTVPSGGVTNHEDCDDGDLSVYPSALEICGDGIDSDCDGSDPSAPCGPTGVLDLDTADMKLLGESTSDQAGTSVATGFLSGDVVEVLIGAPGASSAAGAVYSVLGPGTAGTESLSSAYAKYTGEAGRDSAGTSVALADVDDNAGDDAIIGAPFESTTANAAGAVYIVLAQAPGTTSLSLADAKYLGEDWSDLAGSAVGAGYINGGDAYADVLIGAPGGPSVPGTIYVVNGPPMPGSIGLGSADARLVGETVGDGAGCSVSAGDIDGDGVDDLLVGAAGQDEGASEAGAVYFIRGPVTGLIDLGTATKFSGVSIGDATGVSVATGNVSGTGYEDILIGASGEGAGGTFVGSVYLILGASGGPATNLLAAEARLVGETPGDAAGNSVAAGDFDGDGGEDILVGAHFEGTGGPYAGAAYFVPGPSAVGTVVLSSTIGAKFVGEAEGDEAGKSVAAGDMSGDGIKDFLIGASFQDESAFDAGAVYVVFGGP